MGNGRSSLNFLHHDQRKVSDLFAPVVLGFGAGTFDLCTFEQMEQQRYGPRASESQDLVHLELRFVLDKRRSERSRV